MNKPSMTALPTNIEDNRVQKEEEVLETKKTHVGHRRRRKGKTYSLVCRFTEEEQAMLIRLADEWGLTFNDTILKSLEDAESALKKTVG